MAIIMVEQYFRLEWLYKTFIFNENPMIWNFIKQLKFFPSDTAAATSSLAWADEILAVIKLGHFGYACIHLSFASGIVRGVTMIRFYLAESVAQTS